MEQTRVDALRTIGNICGPQAVSEIEQLRLLIEKMCVAIDEQRYREQLVMGLRNLQTKCNGMKLVRNRNENN